MFIAFPVPTDGNGNADDMLTKLIYYRERLRNEARIPLMDMALYTDCEDDIASTCFADTVSIKYAMEKAIYRMASHRNEYYIDDVLSKHCGVMSNLMYATVNNDYVNHFVTSLNYFFQYVYDSLKAIYDTVTRSRLNTECGFKPSDVLECIQSCIMFDHIITFLYSTLQFPDNSKLYLHLLNIERVIDLITDDPLGVLPAAVSVYGHK